MRKIADKPSSKRRFCISSLKPNSKQFGKVIRTRLGIENKQHWSRDVTFKENACLTRIEIATENLNFIRKITMNLLRKETSTKRSIPKKCYLTALFPEYLTTVLGLQAYFDLMRLPLCAAHLRHSRSIFQHCQASNATPHTNIYNIKNFLFNIIPMSFNLQNNK